MPIFEPSEAAPPPVLVRESGQGVRGLIRSVFVLSDDVSSGVLRF